MRMEEVAGMNSGTGFPYALYSFQQDVKQHGCKLGKVVCKSLRGGQHGPSQAPSFE